MTTIDPRQALLAAMQQQAARLRERSALPRAASTTAAQATTSALAQRLQAIAPQDPQRQRKAARIYLESELAREFGADLVTDPAFTQMVDAVHDQMRQDSEVAAALDAAGELLLANPPA